MHRHKANKFGRASEPEEEYDREYESGGDERPTGALGIVREVTVEEIGNLENVPPLSASPPPKRQRGQQFSDYEKGYNLGLNHGGISYEQIGLRLRIGQSSVARICERHNRDGAAETHHRDGRPPKLDTEDPEVQETLTTIVEENRREPLSSIKRILSGPPHNVSLSDNTLRNYLHNVGLYSYVACHKPELKPHHVPV
ncbi:hypothetical protein HDV00_004875 [Rhizophlyctis rosea]|nr:hypothetical protein HDV00_004875 [Rhizophlyctis rosea]